MPDWTLPEDIKQDSSNEGSWSLPDDMTHDGGEDVKKKEHSQELENTSKNGDGSTQPTQQDLSAGGSSYEDHQENITELANHFLKGALPNNTTVPYIGEEKEEKSIALRLANNDVVRFKDAQEAQEVLSPEELSNASPVEVLDDDYVPEGVRAEKLLQYMNFLERRDKNGVRPEYMVSTQVGADDPFELYNQDDDNFNLSKGEIEKLDGLMRELIPNAPDGASMVYEDGTLNESQFNKAKKYAQWKQSEYYDDMVDGVIKGLRGNGVKESGQIKQVGTDLWAGAKNIIAPIALAGSDLFVDDKTMDKAYQRYTVDKLTDKYKSLIQRDIQEKNWNRAVSEIVTDPNSSYADLEDAGELLGMQLTQQTPQLAMMVLAPEVKMLGTTVNTGMAALGASTGTSKWAEIRDRPDLTTAEKLAISTEVGLTEYMLERVFAGDVNAMKKMMSGAKGGKPFLSFDSVKKIGKQSGQEGLEEFGAWANEALLDNVFTGEDFNFYEAADQTAVGMIMGGTTQTLASGVSSLGRVGTESTRKALQEKYANIKKELLSVNTPNSEKAGLQEALSENVKEYNKLIKEDEALYSKMDDEQVNRIIAINQEIRNIEQAEEGVQSKSLQEYLISKKTRLVNEKAEIENTVKEQEEVESNEKQNLTQQEAVTTQEVVEEEELSPPEKEDGNQEVTNQEVTDEEGNEEPNTLDGDLFTVNDSDSEFDLEIGDYTEGGGSGVVFDMSDTASLDKALFNSEEPKKEVLHSVKNVFNSLSKVLPASKVRVYESAKDFSEKTGEQQSVKGMFENGTIHINLEKATKTTIIHEAFHAMLHDSLNGNSAKETSKNILNRLIGALPRNSKERKRLERFKEEVEYQVSNIEEYDKGDEAEETLAGISEFMVEDFPHLNKSLKTKIKEMLNNIARKIGIKDIFNNDSDVVDFFNTIPKKMSRGEILKPSDTENVFNKASTPSKNKSKKEGGRKYSMELQNNMEQALKTERMFDEHNDAVRAAKKESGNLWSKARNTLIDRQSNIRQALVDANAVLAEAIMTDKAGSTVMADRKFKDIEKRIYGDMTQQEEDLLDMIMFHERVIQIDENHKKKNDEASWEALYWDSQAKDARNAGLFNVADKYEARASKIMESAKDTPQHPRGFTQERSEAALEGLKEKYGDEVYGRAYKKAQDVFAEFNKIMGFMYDNGLVNADTYRRFKNDKYIPRQFLHHLFANEVVHSKEGNGLNAQQIKAIDNGSEELAFMDSRILLNSALRSVYNRKFQNDANNALYETINDNTPIWTRRANYELDKNGAPKRDKWGNYKVKDSDTGFVNVNFFKDGNRNAFQMESQLYNEWMDLNKSVDGTFTKVARAVLLTGLLKRAATGLNPTFFLSNVPMDYMNVLMFTDIYDDMPIKAQAAAHLGARFAALSKGVAAMKGREIFDISKSEKSYVENLFNEAASHGMMMEFLTTYGKPQDVGVRKDESRAKKAYKKVSGKAADLAAFTGEVSEIAMRLAAYEHMMSKLQREGKWSGSDAKYIAASKARKTIDFAQGGTISKQIDQFIPYFNAAMQGFRVAGSYAKKNPMKLANRIAQLSVPVSALVLYNMSVADDDDWAKISDYEKNAYSIIFMPWKNEDGERAYIRIRKNPQAAVFMNAIEMATIKALDKAKGSKWSKSDDDINRAWDTFNDALPFPVDPNSMPSRLPPSVQAMVVYKSNYDPFKNQKVTQDKDKFPPEYEEFDNEYIPAFYKKIGEAAKISPPRLKSAAEKVITTPSTNAIVGAAYTLLDQMVTHMDGDKYGESKNTGVDNILKSVGSKVYKYTTPYNKNNNIKKAEKEIELEENYKDAKERDLVSKMIEDGKGLGDVLKWIGENVKRDDREKRLKYAKTLIRTKDLKKSMPNYYNYLSIMFTEDTDASARKLALHLNGAKIGSEDYKSAIKDMRRLGFNPSDKFKIKYRRAVGEK